VVTSIRTGNTEGSGTAGSVGSGSTLGTALAGLYGSLQVAADGSWLYTLDNTNATVNALATGGSLTEYFNYTVNDRTNGAGTLSDTAVLTITIEGRDDEIRINSVFVNEGSPFAVFKVEATAGTPIDLLLGDNVPAGDDKATATADYGTSLQVWNGTSWVPYTAGVLIPAGDILYVRVAIVNDGIYEGNESFSLTASSTGFVSATGIGTINDEGEGDYWIGDNLDPATEV
jgi:VCBS repeat-containing protein